MWMQFCRQFGIAALLLGFSQVTFSQSNNPTIAVCTGSQFVCASDTLVTICVNIIVDTAYSNLTAINDFEIIWGDGTPNTYVPFSKNPPSQTHTYNVKDWYVNCLYMDEKTIRLNTRHSGNIPNTNSLFILTIIRKPEAGFSFDPGIVCAGNEFDVRDNSCPKEKLTLQTWDFGNNMLDSGSVASFTFNTAGAYPVTHCVGNVCDTVCVQSLIQVLNAPSATASADSGSVQISANTFRVCLGGGGLIRLSANASLNSTSFKWMVVPPSPSGYQWIPNNMVQMQSVARLMLTDTGTYIIRLTTNNDCDEPSEFEIRIEVKDAPLLTLAAQRDTCENFQYQPLPFTSTARYTINGIVQTTWPVSLPLSPMPYIIEARDSNECALQIIRDTFWVQSPETVGIATPSDTTVCTGTDSLVLHGFPDLGRWTASPAASLAIVNGDTLFVPSSPGTFNLVYSKGTGQCLRSDTVVVRVEQGYDLLLEQPELGCIEVQYTPMPGIDPNAAYTINGVPQNSWPTTLPASGAPYTIVASAQNTCGPISKTVVLEIDVPVDVSILQPQNDTVLCGGTADLPLLGSDTSGQWSGPNIVQTPGGYIFQPPIGGGDFELVFSRGQGVCRRADTIQVRVEPGNGVTTASAQWVCQNAGLISLPPASPAGGTWTGPAITGANVDVNALIPGSAYTFTYTVNTLPAACNSANWQLAISPLHDGAFNMDADTGCIGQEIQFTPISTGNNYNYSWDFGDNSPLSTDPMPAHAYLTPGDFTILLRVSTLSPINTLLCETEFSRQVHIVAPPEKVGFLMMPDTGCAILTVSFTNTSIVEKGNFTWSFGNDSTDFSGFSPPPANYNQGVEEKQYIVRLSVETGCDNAFFEDTVTVFPDPTAAFGITYNEPCSGAELEVNNTSLGEPTAYKWYVDGQLIAQQFNPPNQVFFTDTLPRIVELMLVASNHCDVDTAVEYITVNPTNVNALFNLSDTTVICVGDTLVLRNFSTPGAPIRWIIDGTPYLTDEVNAVFADPGVYKIELFAEGCGYDSMIAWVRVWPLPELAVVHDGIACPGMPFNYQITSDAAGTVFYFTTTDSSFTKQGSFAFDSSGVYPLYARAISAKGCISTWSGEVAVAQRPEAVPTVSDSVCAGVPVLFTSTGPTCLWNFGDTNSADQCAANHIYAASGQYNVRLVVVSPEGCRDTAFVPVYVRSTPNASFSTQILEKCSPGKAAFLNTTTNATGYVWMFGDTNTSVLKSPTHTYAAPGNYQVMLIASQEGICFDTARQLLTIYPTPDFELELAPNCTVLEGYDLSIETDLANSTSVTGADYQQDGTFHTGLQQGNYTITISTLDGCSNDTVISVLKVEELKLSVAQDTFYLRLGETAALQATVNQTGVIFNWQPALYLSDPASSAPVSLPFRDIAYRVIATNARNCSKTEDVLIFVQIDRDSGIYIPNAFTPNDDNTNDVFLVRSSNPGVKLVSRMLIYDKWGELLFEATDKEPNNPVFGWDGNFLNAPAMPGIYRYEISILFADGETLHYSGALNLIR